MGVLLAFMFYPSDASAVYLVPRLFLALIFWLSFLAGGRIVPRFQELTPEKLGKVSRIYFNFFKFKFSLEFTHS